MQQYSLFFRCATIISMALLYIVHHATSTSEDTHTIFESEQEAVEEIEKKVALDQEAKAKAKGKGSADEDDRRQSSSCADLVGAWSYRIVAMGSPFDPNINAADPDPDTRAFIDQQSVRANFVQCEPRHPCHLELIAHFVGSSASDVADRMQPYRRSMAVHRLTRRTDNALLDDLHICSFLFSITIYLCTAANAALYSVAQTSAQTGRSLVILREGCKFSLLRPAETTEEN
jgi:hypothetical protein